MNQLGTVKINIFCPTEQKIECEVDKRKEYIIKNLEGSTIEMALPKGVHHISLRQFHMLNTKRWFLYICNPIRFLNYAFFKTEFTKHSAYDADAATVDFDILLEDETRIINLELKVCSWKSYHNQYYKFDFIDGSHKIFSCEHNKENRLFFMKWIFVRLFPSIIFNIVFWLVSICRGFQTLDSWVIPIVYMIMTFGYAFSIFRAKSITKYWNAVKK